MEAERLVGPIEPATKHWRPGIGGDEFIADFAGQFGGLDVEFGDDGFEIVVGLGDGLGVEGVGLDDVGAGLEEAAVDLGDDVGLGEDEEIAVALEVLVMRLEAFAAEIGLGELVLLQGGAHGAVDDDDAFLQESFEGMEGGESSSGKGYGGLVDQGQQDAGGAHTRAELTYQRIWMRQ